LIPNSGRFCRVLHGGPSLDFEQAGVAAAPAFHTFHSLLDASANRPRESVPVRRLWPRLRICRAVMRPSSAGTVPVRRLSLSDSCSNPVHLASSEGIVPHRYSLSTSTSLFKLLHSHPEPPTTSHPTPRVSPTSRTKPQGLANPNPMNNTTAAHVYPMYLCTYVPLCTPISMYPP
jgi:hypothetical protein